MKTKKAECIPLDRERKKAGSGVFAYDVHADTAKSAAYEKVRLSLRTNNTEKSHTAPFFLPDPNIDGRMLNLAALFSIRFKVAGMCIIFMGYDGWCCFDNHADLRAYLLRWSCESFETLVRPQEPKV